MDASGTALAEATEQGLDSLFSFAQLPPFPGRSSQVPPGYVILDSDTPGL